MMFSSEVIVVNDEIGEETTALLSSETTEKESMSLTSDHTDMFVGKYSDVAIIDPLHQTPTLFLDKLLNPLYRGTKFFVDSWVCLIIYCAVGSALGNFFIKLLSRDIPIFQASMMPSIIAFPILCFICKYKKIPVVGPNGKVSLLVARGVIGSITTLMLFISASALPISEQGFLVNSYPVTTAILSWMLGLESLSLISWIGIIGTLIGDALVAHPPFLYGGHNDWDAQRILGFSTAVLAVLNISVLFLILRSIGKTINPWSLTASFHFFQILFCLPFVIFGYPAAFSTRHSSIDLICYVVLAILAFTNYTALARAFMIGPLTKTAAIYVTSMLYSAFLGVVILSEPISWITGIGSVTVFVSILLVVSQKTDQKNIETPLITEITDGLLPVAHNS